MLTDHVWALLYGTVASCLDLRETGLAAPPEQIHLALARSDAPGYAATVSWATPRPGGTIPKSEVLWGTADEGAVNVATGSSSQYSWNDYTSDRLHHVTLSRLEPSTEYVYVCGDSQLGLSTPRSFKTPPAVSADSAVSIGVLGDLGQTVDSQHTLGKIASDDTLSLVLHAGDLSYADCDQPRWDTFMRMLDPVASRLPWMVAPGNHEIELGAAQKVPFAAYQERFSMPAARPPERKAVQVRGSVTEARRLAAAAEGGAPPAGALSAALLDAARVGEERGGGLAAAEPQRESLSMGEGLYDEEEVEACAPSDWRGTYDFGNSFYSFDVASVHVVVLNQYTDTGLDSPQYRWLAEDLEATDRTATPWLVVMMHCPWYNSNELHQGESQALNSMATMEPLLFQHKAAVVFNGHVHAYERTRPVFDSAPTASAPTYIVVGAAGNREGHADAFQEPVPAWTARREGTKYGSGRLSMQNSTLALWEWAAWWEQANQDQVPEDSPAQGDSGSGHQGAGPWAAYEDSVWIVNPYRIDEGLTAPEAEADLLAA